MNQIQTQGQNIANIFTDLLSRFVAFLPSLIAAIVILIIGLIIAAIVAKLVEKVVRMLRIDHVISLAQQEIRGHRGGREIRGSVVLREVVRWFLIFVFLQAAAEAIGLRQLSAFINSILLYLPNVIVAVIILTIALMLGRYVGEFVMDSESVAASKFQNHIVAGLAKWSIIVFGVLAALIQLGIATSLINALFIGVVAAISLAFGLAFGLGGQAEAADIWKRVRHDLMK